MHALSLLLIAPALFLTGPGSALPRFTEEREAAALYFVKKHLPELLPLLGELKKNNLASYQKEISEIFQLTENLADLVEEPRRHKLELEVWKAENRSHLLVARLRTGGEEERKKMQELLREMARELVDLEIQVLEAQSEQLANELGELKDRLARAREERDQSIKSRFESLLDKTRKPRK